MPSLPFLHSPLFNDASLVSYYQLENTSDSKGANTLTNTGSATFTPAKFNNGANLGTSNSGTYLHAATNMGITGGAITLCGWIKILTEPGANAQYYLAVCSSSTNNIGNFIGYQDTSGTKSVFVDRSKGGIGEQIASFNVDLGTTNFHHLAYAYDGSTVNLYVDGINVAQVSASGNGASGYSDLFTLGASFVPNAYASAIYDDWQVFSRVLTATEIFSLYVSHRSISGASSISSPMFY